MTETADEPPTPASRSSPENAATLLKLTRKDFVSDQEVRWCPGCGDYSILAQTQKVMPDFGYPEGEHRLHLRHRLLQPAAVLHEHVRLPHHPRPRADARDRAQGRPARPDGLGHHRRRRRAVDRRQPRPALDAPQRRHQDRHVQQPDLRPDQGPGLADVRARQGDEVDAGRHDRPPAHAAVGRARPPRRRSSPARSTPTPSTCRTTLERAGRHKGTAFVEVYQNCNIFNDGAWRVVHRPGGPRRPHALPGARQADDLRQGPRQGHPPPRPAARRSSSSARTASPRRTCSSTTRRPRTRTSRSCCRGCSTRSSRCRSACSATSSGRPTTSSLTAQIRAAIEQRGEGSLTKLLESGETWLVEASGTPASDPDK